MIYFDNASTTKIDDQVLKEMNLAYDQIIGNPSSLHSLGLLAEKSINKARETIAKKLKISSKNIFFVPSGTIANNTIINSYNIEKYNIVISSVEHASIYNQIKHFRGEIRVVDVDKYGFIDVDDLLSKIDENTKLVSIIHVNNEIGTINKINDLAKIVKSKNSKIIFHSDGVQAFNKIDISLSNIDAYTISSHKINGPKGIAAIYLRDLNIIKPLYFGGGQEKSIFSGTENVHGIIGFAKASTLDNNFYEIIKINKFLCEEFEKMEDCILLSPRESVSPYILSVCFKKLKSEVLLHYLEMDKVYISTGSACSKGAKSNVISNLNVDKEYEDGCIRISLSRNSTMKEAKLFINILKQKLEIIKGIIL